MKLVYNLENDLPSIGFGTWQLNDGPEVQTAVKAALETGYRLIDTARIYNNEAGVGLAVNQSGIPREEIFITTKLWNSDHGYDNAMQAFEDSLERLGMDEVDLYLIHWPGKDNIGSWKALIDIHKKRGGAKSVGVSNFAPQHLAEIIDATGEVPAVNQIEFHPFIYDTQRDTLEFCKNSNIIVEAYSPLARGDQLSHPVISELAKARGKTTAQVMLRWAIQHGTVPIPKSRSPKRIKENIDVFDFELADDEMAALNSLGEGKSALPF